ncbi:reprolysin-like metallo-peptidase family M12B [Tahibacter aquaticus]|uniref:Reprolysin-like metallo-peptidase family M12B n=1 Tax=Tahibacter aquaticus TaxID=520092 RepID=A0A4R6YIG8_9GAMM|nr:zinc-dependent metalloprotease family protein [Tahibacter aquaticus]TDR36670.1 reprolysin-like metallo-peptidase family M12B [Tahibacter aquaticus]
MKRLKFVLAALLLVAAPSVLAAAATQSLWRETVQRALAADAPQAQTFRATALDEAALQTFLSGPARQGEALAVPRPDGGFDEFVLGDSGVMPTQLAAKYPQIKSYIGIAADGTQARIDVSPLGFQAMVFAADGVWIVQPQSRGGGNDYMSFSRGQFSASRDFQCGVHGKPASGSIDRGLRALPVPMTTTGTTRRSYVAAVGTTHQYVAAVSPAGGASVANGLAGVVATMNRVNQVYEKDFAIHMTLVANNDQIIYATAAGDPYPDGDDAIDMNSAHLDSVIGAANYDIGHVLTSGSGVANLGVVCRNGLKGDGTTGATNPTGDAFWIDYVAHEMGHQFGGDHTFNSTTSSCGGNRNGPTAYEPGSGSTIMAYAGICGAADLQPNSDPYFTASSLNEIGTYAAGAGAGCAEATPNPNPAPVIVPLSSFIVPARTPFTLSGSATTSSGGTLSYGWEQNDIGPANNNLAADPGNGPIMRSLNPTPTGVRTIPRLSNLVAGTALKGEVLPTTARTLHFRLTVRDNVPNSGSTSSADMTVQSVVTSGAFKVNTPNTAVSWAGNSSQSVTWDVAGTAAAPISCAQVGIDVSTDGGLTYPLNVGSFPNSGSATIVVPNVTTSAARIRVSCVGNIFFNISAPNFAITAASDVIFANGFQVAAP